MPEEIRLLVADANASVREVVRLAVSAEGWACDTVPDGISALKLLQKRRYDLLVLEIALPEVDGKIVCRQLRKRGRTPVIFTGTGGGEEERLAAFAAGGNDYVLKPFYPRELVARAKNLINLAGGLQQGPAAMTAGHIRLEQGARHVFVDGRRVHLAPKEYELLSFLMQNPRQAFSRGRLLDLVWGPDFDGVDRTVDTHIMALRGKIRPFQDCIETIWNYGYLFSPDRAE